jgi:hypothetical protein
MKTPFVYRSIPKAPDYFIKEDFSSQYKYNLDPRSSFNSNKERIYEILNPTQRKAIIIIERDSGTSFTLLHGPEGSPGDEARNILKKCIEKDWLPRFFIPGVSFSMSNGQAEPGEPLEIKFYFYEIPFTAKDTEETRSKKYIDYTKQSIIHALKTFYAFEAVEVNQKMINKIMDDKTIFFRFTYKDNVDKIVGLFDIENITVKDIVTEDS